MRRILRDRWALAALCTLIPAAACTRLTSVDWSKIKEPTSNGGSSASSGAGEGGDTDDVNGGHDPIGQGGALEGGAAGEAGADIGGSAGSGGIGGNAGGGIGGGGLGGGGTGGGGMGGAGTGGGGTGGGDMGGGGGIINVGGSSAIAESVVLYDGGADEPDCDYDGRAGLNARCASKKGALPHSKSVAFISVSATDDLYHVADNYQVPKDKRIVSVTGVLLADSWIGLLGDGAPSGGVVGRLNTPLIAAGVLPASAFAWLSGSLPNGGVDNFGTCEGWERSTYSTEFKGRYGKPNVTLSTWLSSLWVTCDTNENHVLCLAYD